MPQISDDPELLNLMLGDTRTASDIYRPTNFWANYERKLLSELRTFGLTDFRRRDSLSSFGATDRRPTSEISLLNTRFLSNKYSRKIPFWQNLLSLAQFILNKSFYVSSPWGITADEITHLSYWYVRSNGIETGAKSIDLFEASLVGNPENVISVNNRIYTMNLLAYYLYYTHCFKFVDFSSLKLVVELGPAVESKWKY